MLVGYGQVVVCGRVARIDLRRTFPAIDRFTPQPALRNRYPELDLEP